MKTNRNVCAKMKKQIDRVHPLIRAAQHVSDSTVAHECVPTNSIDVNATALLPSWGVHCLTERKL